jgi:hypothetical protein
LQKQQLQTFWQQQIQEIEQVNGAQLPISGCFFCFCCSVFCSPFPGDGLSPFSASSCLCSYFPALCTEFRNHQLPLARIKKIMKSDEDVKVKAILAMVK